MGKGHNSPIPTPYTPFSILLRRFGKPAPADTAHDDLSRWNLPRMKLHLAPKSPATGPVITGHKGGVSTPTSFDPAKAFYDRCHATAFQIARLMLRKALERFLSVY